MKFLALFALVGMLGVPQNAAAQHRAAHPTLLVGVWTLWHDRELDLAASPQATVRTCDTCSRVQLTQPLHVSAAESALSWNDGRGQRRAEALWLEGGVTLSAHGEQLRLHHPLKIVAENGVLRLAATVPLESYVERVVASESGPADSAESLKALAIVVRTFAVHERHGHEDYDLCDSTHCQLLHWAGNPSRSRAAHAAALHTAGETLWYRGRPALGYFNKDCGGRSAAVQQIWPRATAAPYLAAREDAYCARSSGAEWSSQVTRAQLAEALARAGLAPAGWKRLEVAKRSPEGRVLILRVDGREINAEDFRIAIGQALGWNQAPSTWFEVSRQGDVYVFRGRGWGHGVGLCQKGAAAMAQQGRSATEVLAQYFPGAIAVDDTTGKSWREFSGKGVRLETLSEEEGPLLKVMEREYASARSIAGLQGPEIVTVRSFESAEAFRNATLAPGWMAGFTEGDWIALQPLRVLSARHTLERTLRHEFLHAIVEREAGPAAPLWLREGLVEVWTGEPVRQPHINLAQVESALSHPNSQSEAESAHAAAGAYAAAILKQYGRARVQEWLRSGVPADALRNVGIE